MEPKKSIPPLDDSAGGPRRLSFTGTPYRFVDVHRSARRHLAEAVAGERNRNGERGPRCRCECHCICEPAQ
jgi:hypothetical protein